MVRSLLLNNNKGADSSSVVRVVSKPTEALCFSFSLDELPPPKISSSSRPPYFSSSSSLSSSSGWSSSGSGMLSTSSDTEEVDNNKRCCNYNSPPQTSKDTSRIIWNGQHWVRLVAGCVPIVRGGKILMVSKESKSSDWIIPKGGWENDEDSLEECALRESLEEAGIYGKLGRKLNDVEYETRKSQKKKKTTRIRLDESSSNTHHHTHVRLSLFPLYVSQIRDSWPESSCRCRRVVDIDEAIRLLESRPELQAALLQVKAQGLHLQYNGP